jgi:hypothetical protein
MDIEIEEMGSRIRINSNTTREINRRWRENGGAGAGSKVTRCEA